jgi:hypothetical protein
VAFRDPAAGGAWAARVARVIGPLQRGHRHPSTANTRHNNSAQARYLASLPGFALFDSVGRCDADAGGADGLDGAVESVWRGRRIGRTRLSVEWLPSKFPKRLAPVYRSRRPH